ncbi:MAG TPA: LptA/OstA family protein [Myxococcota bacterium]
MSGDDLASHWRVALVCLTLALPAAGAAPPPEASAPRVAIGVAAFESVGLAGAPGTDVARLLADRIGTRGVNAVVGPGELGAPGGAEPTPAEVQAWAAAAGVSTIAVGRSTWIGGRQSIDVRLRTGDSGGLLGTYVAEAKTPEELASGLDRLAAEIVAATVAWLKTDVAAAPPSRAPKPPRDEKDNPFGLGGFESDQPLSIHSEELEASQTGGTRRLVFKRGVRVEQADMKLQADRLEAFYPEKASQPERLVATGDVRVVQGAREAHCDEATYFRADKRLVCDGHAELRDGDDRVAGARIEFDLASERVVVKGGASVLFHPEPEKPEPAPAVDAKAVPGGATP